jgi:hypothetical protein
MTRNKLKNLRLVKCNFSERMKTIYAEIFKIGHTYQYQLKSSGNPGRIPLFI